MTAAITLDGVTKRFGTVTAVDDLNLEFRQDVITGLLGRNGAGKTVTMSLVTAQERPTSGTIRVLGRNPRENAPSWPAPVSSATPSVTPTSTGWNTSCSSAPHSTGAGTSAWHIGSPGSSASPANGRSRN